MVGYSSVLVPGQNNNARSAVICCAAAWGEPPIGVQHMQAFVLEGFWVRVDSWPSLGRC